MVHDNKDISDKPGYAARLLALDMIDAVVNHGQSLDALQPQISAAGLAREDRAFAMTLTLHSLRYYTALKKIILGKMQARLPQTARRAEAILVLGAAQLLLLETPAHAAVGLSVDLAKARMFTKPYAKLINAVLRRLSEDPHPQFQSQTILPDWLMQRWSTAYGEATAQRMGVAQLVEPPLDLSCKSDAASWAQKLGGMMLPHGTVRLNDNKGGVEHLQGFEDGEWWVQDAAARLPVLAMGDVAGKSVLDMCAAPGGKTAVLLAAGAQVVALDRSKPRLNILQQNLERLNFQAELICADAEKWTTDKLFDAILLDAPCSSTGTLRRHPDVAYVKKDADVLKLAFLQKRLLAKAAQFVKPGGIIVYATCSLEPEEGEHQVDEFMSQHPSFSLSPLLPQDVGGMDEVIAPEGWLRARPDMLAAQGGMDGFFSARFVRNH